MAVSKDKTEEWKQKAKENQEKAFEMIHAVETAYISDSNKIIDFLKTASHFYQYSINNLKLIYAQNPNATYVQSFEAWKKTGFSVQRGQKGMKIFVPVRVTLLKLADGEFVSLSEATAEQKRMYESGELESHKKTSYKIGNVFDIKQTNFPPERYAELLGEEKEQSYVEQLRRLAGIATNNNSIMAESTFEGLCCSIMIQHSLGEEISEDRKNLFAELLQDYEARLKLNNPTLSDAEMIKSIDESLDGAIKQFRLAIEPEIEEKTPIVDSKESIVIESAANSVSKKRSLAEQNYSSMLELAPEVLSGDLEYMRFGAGECFDKLTIEKIGSNRIAMSHTFIQNGDVMADPDMEFEVNHEEKTLNARSFQNDLMQYYTCVTGEDGHINRALENELNDFTKTWLKNIKGQGYKPFVEQEQIEEAVNEEIYEEKRMLLKGDIIEYEGKKWRVTENDNNFMISAENLDPTDINSSFQWIGNIEDHDYKIIKEISKTVVALESTEDYSDYQNGFYTYSYQDGRSGIRYRLVTIGEDGCLKPYSSDSRFFISKSLAEEYINKHAAELEVIPYDSIVYRASAEMLRMKMEQQQVNKTEKKYYFEVVECSEFHSMGQVYSEIESVTKAIEQYNDIESKKRTLGPGINLIVSSAEGDSEISLSSGRNIDLDMFGYYPDIQTDEQVKKMVQEFVKEAKKSGFQTYGSYSFEDSEQQNMNNRRRRGR